MPTHQLPSSPAYTLCGGVVLLDKVYGRFTAPFHRITSQEATVLLWGVHQGRSFMRFSEKARKGNSVSSRHRTNEKTPRPCWSSRSQRQSSSPPSRSNHKSAMLTYGVTLYVSSRDLKDVCCCRMAQVPSNPSSNPSMKARQRDELDAQGTQQTQPPSPSNTHTVRR